MIMQRKKPDPKIKRHKQDSCKTLSSWTFPSFCKQQEAVGNTCLDRIERFEKIRTKFKGSGSEAEKTGQKLNRGGQDAKFNESVAGCVEQNAIVITAKRRKIQGKGEKSQNKINELETAKKEKEEFLKVLENLDALPPDLGHCHHDRSIVTLTPSLLARSVARPKWIRSPVQLITRTSTPAKNILFGK